MIDILNELFLMQDVEYKAFHRKLIPTVDEAKVIGVRIPELRKYAKRISGSKEAKDFLNSLPHNYYEENNLHAFLAEGVKDFDEALRLTEKFLLYIDNWATCDSFMPPVFKKNKDKLLPYVKNWVKDNKTYTIRYGIGLLMKLWLDDDFDTEYIEMVAKVKSQEYYVNMMIAWYFATALAKQYEIAIEYIEDSRLPVWVQNKAIQKAIESNRIAKETKTYLRSLKR